MDNMTLFFILYTRWRQMTTTDVLPVKRFKAFSSLNAWDHYWDDEHSLLNRETMCPTQTFHEVAMWITNVSGSMSARK